MLCSVLVPFEEDTFAQRFASWLLVLAALLVVAALGKLASPSTFDSPGSVVYTVASKLAMDSGAIVAQLLSVQTFTLRALDRSRLAGATLLRLRGVCWNNTIVSTRPAA